MIKYFTFLIAILMFPKMAYAYIDPGTGSFVIQIVIAFIAVMSFYFKFIWKNIKDLFRYLLSKKNKDNKTEDNIINEYKQK